MLRAGITVRMRDDVLDHTLAIREVNEVLAAHDGCAQATQHATRKVDREGVDNVVDAGPHTRQGRSGASQASHNCSCIGSRHRARPYPNRATTLDAARTTREARMPISSENHESTVAHAGVMATKPGLANGGCVGGGRGLRSC